MSVRPETSGMWMMTPIPNGDGTTWGTAFMSLQDAFDASWDDDDIRVAGGRYIPSEVTDPNDPRAVTFQIYSGVALYGGLRRPGRSE